MMHDDLLDIAAHLAQLEEGKPRQTSLRRAVSSAYYALFHALAALCANKLVRYSKPWRVYAPIYRTLDHGRAKDVFKRMLAGYAPTYRLLDRLSFCSKSSVIRQITIHRPFTLGEPRRLISSNKPSKRYLASTRFRKTNVCLLPLS